MRLGQRLRSPVLQAAHAAWEVLGGTLHLPSPARMDGVTFDRSHFSLAEILRDGGAARFRLISAGPALVAQAGRALVGECIGTTPPRLDEDPIGGAVWAYGRCQMSGRPSHEFGHFDFGDGTPLLFERLLLPLGQGSIPTHILCGALFSGAR